MAEKVKKDKSARKAEKSSKKDKKPSKTKEEKEDAAAKAFSLLADESTVDANLSSLFEAKPAPAKPRSKPSAQRTRAPESQDVVEDEDSAEDDDSPAIDGEPGEYTVDDAEVVKEPHEERKERKRKRKRRDADEDLEGAYMDRMAREEEKDALLAAADRASKRQKPSSVVKDAASSGDEAVGDEIDGGVEVEAVDSAPEANDDDEYSDEDIDSPPPQHETQQAADVEHSQANRTVFLGNVSTTAIESKSARKTLDNHLTSFFASVPTPNDKTKHKIESIRFRSTPYASAIPKKAAFARKDLMDATAKSTNAYAVYSSPVLSREAAKHLNGTIVLDRHLRVDEIAHPAKTDHRRCVFVGNLGFVDDETNIQDANEEEGREKRKRGKEPADVEEGLWRSFGRCGTVESVRVIRDSTTRVGKGIAYVQFEDPNAVEAALLYDGKKFPPMLPRKLRVSRAKAVKRNAKPGSGRPTTGKQSSANGYQRKVSGEEASRMGRVGKLYGRAAAAKVKRHGGPEKTGSNDVELGVRGAGGASIKNPEDFVFEGHRASSKSGKPGLKLGGKKKGGKPTNRSAKRGAVFKAGGRKKAR